MKTNVKARLSVLAVSIPVILLLTPMASASADTSGQPLVLSIQSIITNAGTQQYSLAGGTIAAGEVFANALPPGASVQFNLFATVLGLSTTGYGNLQVSYQGAGGVTTQVQANIVINGEVPAAIFPLDNSGNNCNPTVTQCNSQIPLLFTGIATISTSGQSSTTQLPIAIESAYWNPFGAPIVITSLESSSAPAIFLVTSYTQATINWSGVEVDGGFAGTVGTSAETGLYTSQATSFEDLLAGHEYDSGTITFYDTTGPLQTISGKFAGQTTISTAGSFDCSLASGLPLGTCTATGASSAGTFKMVNSHNLHVTGTYSTTWSVPSLTAATSVAGSVTSGT